LTLTVTRLVTQPSSGYGSVLDTMLYVGDCRTKALPVAPGFQSMDRFAAGTTQAAQENSLRKGVKIGSNETVPPKSLPAVWATGGFCPGEKSAKTSNLIDVGSNKKYQ
jgi:hypothetical protein